MNRSFLPILASVLVLGACGKGTAANDFAAVEFSEFESWGRGLEDFGAGAGAGGGTDSGMGGGSGGGGTSAYDGTWQGTYSFSAELTDYGYTCSCSSDLTLGIVEGSLQVGQGGICNMDCGINTRLQFTGNVGETGSGAGSVEEATSFYFSTSWVGTFSETAASGTFTDTVATDQGAANVSGSFSVAPL
jgi:hypothetical protein